MVKDDSLYIIAIVAVVAVVGLVIMATGSTSTVMVAEDLPSMAEESENSAIAGQAIGLEICSLSEKTAHNYIDLFLSEEEMIDFIDSLQSCSCEELSNILDYIQTYQGTSIYSGATAVALYELYMGQCTNINGETSSNIEINTNEDDNSFGTTIPSTSGSSTTQVGDIGVVTVDYNKDYPFNERVNSNSDEEKDVSTSDYNDCNELAEMIYAYENHDISQYEEDIKEILSNAKQFCDCDTIDNELSEYLYGLRGETWTDTWSGWMIRNCFELRLEKYFQSLEGY